MRSRGSLEFGIGWWLCSTPFLIFNYLYTYEILLYSQGLHVSRGGGPLHYTVFGFYERRRALRQSWAMHVDKDGTSTYVPSKKQRIFWQDITHLSYPFVNFLSSLYILSYFF
jgi:hypothetical protein